MPDRDSLLLTDLYELAMLQAYAEHGLAGMAVFEFFVRKLPPGRGFLMAAGLEQTLAFLETARFTAEDCDALRRTGRFPDSFIERLAGFRFTGDVDALPEGTIFFPDEPILRVAAPLPQAQLVETRLINLLHFQTVIASKAARMVLAAPGKQLIDFGLRRAHGAEAGVLAARASYIAGFAGTATVSAALRFGIPMQGTMAHSFIQTHGDEERAFEKTGTALLQPIMRRGRILAPLPALQAVRDHAADQLRHLPPPLQRLERAPYAVQVSGRLRRLADDCDRATGG